MTSRQYQWITAGALCSALVGVAFSWRWADQTYRAGDRMGSYWIGVAGSSLPALALTGCALWLWRERKRGVETATVPWLLAALGSSAVLLAFMILFPML